MKAVTVAVISLDILYMNYQLKFFFSLLETMQDDVWFPSPQGPIDKALFINDEALNNLLLSSDDGLVKRTGMTKRTKKRSQQIPHCGYGSCVNILSFLNRIDKLIFSKIG